MKEENTKPEDSVKGDIDTVLGHLGTNIGALSQRLDALEQKLGPALSAGSPTEGVSELCETRCDLSRRIAEIVCVVDLKTAHVDELIERIEL